MGNSEICVKSQVVAYCGEHGIPQPDLAAKPMASRRPKQAPAGPKQTPMEPKQAPAANGAIQLHAAAPNSASAALEDPEEPGRGAGAATNGPAILSSPSVLGAAPGSCRNLNPDPDGTLGSTRGGAGPASAEGGTAGRAGGMAAETGAVAGAKGAVAGEGPAMPGQGVAGRDPGKGAAGSGSGGAPAAAPARGLPGSGKQVGFLQL